MASSGGFLKSRRAVAGPYCGVWEGWEGWGCCDEFLFLPVPKILCSRLRCLGAWAGCPVAVCADPCCPEPGCPELGCPVSCCPVGCCPVPEVVLDALDLPVKKLKMRLPRD